MFFSSRSLFLLLLFNFIAFHPHLAFSQILTGKVIFVADGDTITILSDHRQTRIRLYGIDTPEKGQAFGRKAKKFPAPVVAVRSSGNSLKPVLTDPVFI